jgi:predicted AAA+ superfamily ATPase
MILQSEIEASVLEQKQLLQQANVGLERGVLPEMSLLSDYVTIITGIRRCGKSTLMHQLMEGLNEEFAYFNFEDPRVFGFDVNDFVKLENVFGNQQVYFFDEIQNIENWELFVRKLHDQGKTVCITGSNASLLSKELGTRLTGRHLQKELFPFDYDEFCAYLEMEQDIESLDRYLELGGFPSYLKNGQLVYLQQLFRDILYRDIIVRHGVRNAKIIEGIALYLISNVGKEFSLNGIKKTFDVGSANSVADYVAWFEDSYLLFTLPRFSWSLKSIAVNPKKVYTIDTGFAQANSLSFSEDKGRLFENMIYLKLRREGKELYYFREKGECDFVVKEQQQVTTLIQACYELHPDNLQRELNGLKEAMDFFGLDHGTIVTRNQNDEFMLDGKKISAVSADRWL